VAGVPGPRRVLRAGRRRSVGFRRAVAAVVRTGHVGNVGVRDGLHVAGDAAILPGLLPADNEGKRTTPLGVAFQATATVEGYSLVGGRLLMWVVTGDAAQLSLTLPEAAAQIHLLDVAGELVPM